MPTDTVPEFGTAAPHGDPDLDNLHDGTEVDDSDLAAIAAELAATVVPTTTVVVPGRPGDWSVRCRLDFTGQDLDLLRKKAKNKRYTDGVDGVRFSSLLLGLTCQAVRRGGADLELDGRVQTFTSPELQEILGTSTADATARALFGLEGYLDSAARKVMTEAGWGDEADLADPTE